MALVPLLVWLRGLPDDSDGGRAALRGGLVFGAVHFGLLFYWVPLAAAGLLSAEGAGQASASAAVGVPGVAVSATDVAVGVPGVAVSAPGVALGTAAVAGLAFVAVVGGLALLCAVFVRLLHHAVRGVGAPLWLAVPVIWTGFEWTRAHLPGTLALPWLDLGTSMTGFPELVGVAEIVGSRGVGFWIAAVNALVAVALIRARRARRARRAPQAQRTPRARWPRLGVWPGSGSWVRSAAAATAVATLPMAWGVWRASTLATRPVAEVAVVQPNAGGRTKVDGRGSAAVSAAAGAAVDRLLQSVDSGSVDLVVLPEAFVRGVVGQPSTEADLGRLGRWSADLGVPILFGGLGGAEGALEGDAAVTTEPLPFNSAFIVEPDGRMSFRYDKRRLVPVVERAPFVPAGAGGLLESSGAYAVGSAWPTAAIDGVDYGVLICYESSYPEAARALRRAGADVLVNVTNDAWLGGEPLVRRTAALWQHPAHLVMRAIETRAGVVRSANTGISLFIDPVGRVHDATGLFRDDLRVHEVRTSDARTFWVAWGDLLGNASALAVLGLLLVWWTGGRWGARWPAWARARPRASAALGDVDRGTPPGGRVS